MHRPLINFFTNKKENISIWMTYEICNAKPVLLTERLEKICDNVELKNWGIFTFVLCKIPFDCKRLFCAPVSWIKKFCGFTRKEIFYEVVCVMSLLPGNAENENYQNDFGWQPQKSHLQLSFRNLIKKAKPISKTKLSSKVRLRWNRNYQTLRVSPKIRRSFLELSDTNGTEIYYNRPHNPHVISLKVIFPQSITIKDCYAMSFPPNLIITATSTFFVIYRKCNNI